MNCAIASCPLTTRYLCFLLKFPIPVGLVIQCPEPHTVPKCTKRRVISLSPIMPLRSTFETHLFCFQKRFLCFGMLMLLFSSFFILRSIKHNPNFYMLLVVSLYTVWRTKEEVVIINEVYFF